MFWVKGRLLPLCWQASDCQAPQEAQALGNWERSSRQITLSLGSTHNCTYSLLHTRSVFSSQALKRRWHQRWACQVFQVEGSVLSSVAFISGPLCGKYFPSLCFWLSAVIKLRKEWLWNGRNHPESVSGSSLSSSCSARSPGLCCPCGQSQVCILKC